MDSVRHSFCAFLLLLLIIAPNFNEVYTFFTNKRRTQEIVQKCIHTVHLVTLVGFIPSSLMDIQNLLKFIVTTNSHQVAGQLYSDNMMDP
ncbi:hypothetical protein HOLleu_24290 [Holothuria leucospilota]|uniref:Secreted protein n=1 Tax=Holothuria leucospilota TaxID=206669 RepID=A0A9Q1BWE8_HOLLE|nr:hypothetical protein HOLleu_24290 [Holothuria leucospilota]